MPTSKLLVPVALLVAAVSFSGAAQAAGCLSGAAVGGVGGHVAGHHAVAGAVVGCAVGHHMKVKQEKKDAAAARQRANTPTPARTHGQRAPTEMLDELMAMPS
jgi:hypothetical protein